jgi:hypothetical protein
MRSKSFIAFVKSSDGEGFGAVSSDVLPTILGIVLVAAAAAFALVPFARGARADSLSADSLSADAAVPDRFGLYRQVLELEFDHQLGKLSAEDLAQQSRELLAEAGEALRDERGSIGELDAEIEREITAARAAFAAARQWQGAEDRTRAAGTPS